MTLGTLKETLHDRITLLEAGLDQMMNQPRALVITHTREGAQELGRLEGRLEEARVIFRLVDQVATDALTRQQEEREHPLRIVPSMTFVGEDPDRHDPGRC